jgi:hypothetical protein
VEPPEGRAAEEPPPLLAPRPPPAAAAGNEAPPDEAEAPADEEAGPRGGSFDPFGARPWFGIAEADELWPSESEDNPQPGPPLRPRLGAGPDGAKPFDPAALAPIVAGGPPAAPLSSDRDRRDSASRLNAGSGGVITGPASAAGGGAPGAAERDEPPKNGRASSDAGESRRADRMSAQPTMNAHKSARPCFSDIPRSAITRSVSDVLAARQDSEKIGP